MLMQKSEDSSNFPTPLKAKKRPGIIRSEDYRVITRPYIPSPESRIKEIIDRVLRLTEYECERLLDEVLHDFSNRHRNFRDVLEKNYQRVERFVDASDSIAPEVKQLIGAYFTCEYSVEAAALFNPSIVIHPDQSRLQKGSTRFIMSFRAVGEGHISSIEFRSGVIDKNNDIFFDANSQYIEPPEVHPNRTYDLHHFNLKLNEMGACNDITGYLLERLPASFTVNDLNEKIKEIDELSIFDPERKANTIKIALWLARSNYEISFDPNHNVSERVIFPVSESESGGIEDARFVRFEDDNGSVRYYATYTAYDGSMILPQLIETDDFVTFQVITLNGKAVQNKGMGLFPRKIGGQYVMLSRQDGENNHIMFSDNLHFWQESQVFQRPTHPWEFMQIGNCGSPVETDEGWLMLTHGVGAMRRYCIGVQLLDLDEPSKIIGIVKDPILVPSADERDGYVPNVVYSCGAMVHAGELIVPYAVGDQYTRVATIELDEIFARVE